MNESGPPSIDDFDTLPDDERLLTLANGVSAMSFAGLGGRTIAMREGKAEFGAGEPKVGAWISLAWFFFTHFDARIDVVVHKDEPTRLYSQLHWYF